MTVLAYDYVLGHNFSESRLMESWARWSPDCQGQKDVVLDSFITTLRTG